MCAPLAWRLETGYRCYRSLPSYRQIELHLGVEFTEALCESVQCYRWVMVSGVIGGIVVA